MGTSPACCFLSFDGKGEGVMMEGIRFFVVGSSSSVSWFGWLRIKG